MGPLPLLPASGVWIGQVNPPSKLKIATDPIRYQPVRTYGSFVGRDPAGFKSPNGPKYAQAWSLATNGTGNCVTVKVSPRSSLCATTPFASSVPKKITSSPNACMSPSMPYGSEASTGGYFFC